MTTDKNPTSFRLSDQALDNLDTITRATGTNRTAAVEMALGLLSEKFKGDIEMSTKFNRRNWLNQKFDELYVGQLEEIDQLTDDQLESLIGDIQELLDRYGDEGVSSNAFMDEVEIVVNPYLDDISK